MKSHMFPSSATTLLLCSLASICQAQSQSGDFADLANEFVTQTSALAVPPLALSFVENIQSLGEPSSLTEQQQVFEQFSAKLAAVDSAALTTCQKIDHAIMSLESRFGARRAKLGLVTVAREVSAEGAERVLDLDLGLLWYRYFLDRWNGAELSLETIFAFGERELAQSVANYRETAAQLGFAGRLDKFAEHLSTHGQTLTDDAEVAALFAARQRTVRDHMAQAFNHYPGIEPAHIKRSDRGESFAVPGYYIPNEKTFYYGAPKGGYDVRQADWLFLHEATPGHHFQLSLASTASRCASQLPERFDAAYSEGWAAYVETLGDTLGVYATPYARLGAIEWDLVRSVRVVLDIGLNAYGWSDARALRYWHEHVPGQDHIAQREIDRMKRWPAQAITYKYGAAVFEALRQKHAPRHDDAVALRRFHAAALEFGSMPLSALQSNLGALLGAVDTNESMKPTATRPDQSR